MKLCEYSSDNTAFALLAYFGALLPWAILPVVDPLGRDWITFRRARCYVVGYFFISFIPYGSLIPYAILQKCSQDPDRKEFLMAIVTILVSFINTGRAWRGIFALHDLRVMWQAVEVKTMEDYLRNGYSNDMIKYVSEHIPKPLSDVCVSNYLIDNDFPGEAPRTIYRLRMQNSWPFVTVKVTILDLRERLCIYALWTIWMLTNPTTQHNPITFPDMEDVNLEYEKIRGSGRIHRTSTVPHVFPGGLPENNGTARAGDIPFFTTPNSHMSGGVPGNSGNIQTNYPVSTNKRLLLRHGNLALAFKDSYSFNNVVENFENPFLLAKVLAVVLRHGTTLKHRQPSATLPKRLSGATSGHHRPSSEHARENSNNVNPFTFETIGSITSDNICALRSKLPIPADNSLGWVTPGIAQKWAVHLELNRAGLKSLNSRITAALGLPGCCGGLIQEWWKGPLFYQQNRGDTSSGDIRKTNYPFWLWKRAAFISVVAILEFHRRPGDRPSCETDREALEERLEYITYVIDFLVENDPIILEADRSTIEREGSLFSQRAEEFQYEVRNKGILNRILEEREKKTKKLLGIRKIKEALELLKQRFCREINEGSLLRSEVKADEERKLDSTYLNLGDDQDRHREVQKLGRDECSHRHSW